MPSHLLLCLLAAALVTVTGFGGNNRYVTAGSGCINLSDYNGVSYSRNRETRVRLRMGESDADIDTKEKPFRRSFWPTVKRLLGRAAAPRPGRLILVRHGESEMNVNVSFTGWIDADVTETGLREMEHAARLLTERGYVDIDRVYTSMLKRSIRSSWILLGELNQVFRPVYKSWRLNQRMYGAIEGVSHYAVTQQLGEEIVQEYRDSLFVRPAPMKPEHPHWHAAERKYQDIGAENIPVTESVVDCFDRVTPLLAERILPDVQAGRTVLVVAHKNSIRGIVKYIDNLSNAEVAEVVIPNGSPVVYKFDRRMKPLKQSDSVGPASCSYLEDGRVLGQIIDKEKRWGLPDFKSIKGPYSLIDYADSSLAVAPGRGSAVSNPNLKLLTRLSEERQMTENNSAADGGGVAEAAVAETAAAVATAAPSKMPIIKKYKKTQLDGPFIVFIRHGKTEYNKLGIFTGWDDAPLAAEGRAGATRAGRILKMHGIEFDVCYTSWLSRAIETAWLVLDELDLLWLPLIKSWRLNERMYGALTGMSKRGIAERFGDVQFRAWRRGYSVRPPPVSPFSLYYPGNDDRYIKYVSDIRISLSQTIVRSIFNRRFELHRKFPTTESLKDCMRRTIPYYTDTIMPQGLTQGKRVLIASSENAIRGLLMHLCDIPPHRIHEIDIPNSLPMVYDPVKKCIRVLDDGEESAEDFYNPLRRFPFGQSPELIFKPCDYAGNTEQCFIGENGVSYSYDPIIRLVEDSSGGG